MYDEQAETDAVYCDICGHHHFPTCDQGPEEPEDEAPFEDDDTTCASDDCDDPNDDGEGWNGYCGNCADRIEAEEHPDSDRMSDYSGYTIDAVDLTGGDDPRFTAQVNDDGTAAIIFAEPLAFHANYLGTDWHAWVDADGNLTPERDAALAQRVQGWLGLLTAVETIDTGADEPMLELEILTSYRADETLDQWHDRIGWPVIAMLTNVSDPGTFNSPYLFASIED